MKLLQPGTTTSREGVLAGTRLLLSTFAVLTALATYQLLVHAADTEHYFAWTIQTQLSAGFLGAAFASGCVLSVLALRQDRWSGIRVALVTVTAYTVVALVATLIHHHRLHLWDGGLVPRAVAWFWLAVYLVIPFACMLVVRRQGIRRAEAEPILRPLPDWLVVLLAVEGAVLVAAGGVGFGGGVTVHPEGLGLTGLLPWHPTPPRAGVRGARVAPVG